MKHFPVFLFCIVTGLLIISCSSNELETTNSNNIHVINLVISQPRIDTSTIDDNLNGLTRSVFYGQDLSFNFGFTKGDTIGIFPENDFQIAFKLNVPEGQILTSSAIKAEGWNTKNNILYACYMPFKYDNKRYDHIPWDLRVIQVQRGNNNKDSLSKYAVYASDTVETTNDIFGTTLYYMGSIVAIKFVAPVSANYTRVVVAADNKLFATYGYFDLFDVSATKQNPMTITACPYLHQPFHAEGYTDHETMDLKDVTVSSGTTVWTWFTFPETPMTGKNLTIYVWDNKGNCYTMTRSVSWDFDRNTMAGLTFKELTLTTTPYTNLNPWEEDKDTCSTCYPVAF